MVFGNQSNNNNCRMSISKISFSIPSIYTAFMKYQNLVFTIEIFD